MRIPTKNAMDVSVFEQEWPQLAGGNFDQTGFGRSHWTRIVYTENGNFVFRVYAKNTTKEKIHYEFAILGKLQNRTLPFSIPTPVPNRQGQLLATIQSEHHEKQAVVWRYISGENPDFSNAHDADIAGQALGQLAQALKSLSDKDDLEVCPHQNYRNFLLEPDESTELLQSVSINDNLREPLNTLFREIQYQISAWYRQLPQQTIHNDFLPGNILVDKKVITGVLDFESTRFDLGILDLVVALCHWPYDLFSTGAEWAILDALGKGFAKYRPLYPVEIQHLPQLFRLRWALNVQYFVLQHIRENLPINILEMFMDGALKNEQWVAKNGDELIQRATLW